MLQNVYSKFRGHWTIETEREYQQLRVLEPTMLLYQEQNANRDELQRTVSAENWNTASRRL